MQKNYDPRRYPLATFDDHLCLRPPLLLWLSALYLSRAASLPLVLGVSSIAGGSANTTGLVHGLFGIQTVLPSCIAFLVLCTLALRSPSAGRVTRWIFSHGRVLLSLAAALDAGLALGGVSWQQVAGGDEQFSGILLGATFDVYFLVYLLFSKRVRDVFSDFPAADH